MYSGIPSQLLLLCDTMKISASLTISGLCHYRIGLNEEFVETAFKIEYFQEGVMKIKIERLMGDWKGRGEVACVEEVVGDIFEGGQVSSFGMEGLMGGGWMGRWAGGWGEEDSAKQGSCQLRLRRQISLNYSHPSYNKALSALYVE